MKKYFVRPRPASSLYSLNSLENAWGPRSPICSSEAHASAAAAAAAAAAAFGVEAENAQQLATLEAIRQLVETERQEYRKEVLKNSKKTYCVVCEKTVVTGSALRCASCGVRTPGCSAFSLLPDGFNPAEATEEEGGVCSPSSPTECSGVCTPQKGGANEEFLRKAYGAGIETAGEEEIDERPAVWCHQKNCKNETDAKGLLICSKCRRCFHAGCCEPPLNFEMVTRFPWQCADCKICELCYSNRNEETMLICDACDRAFHMECLDPPVDEVPEGDWFCKGCGFCSCCGRQLTEEEALDTSCFYSNRSRICPECKEKYLRVKGGRVLRQGDLSFDVAYAASSKKHAAAKLCEVCVGPLESDGKGSASRVWCTDCKISVHLGCAVPGGAANEHICLICNGFREDFALDTQPQTT